MKTIDRVLSFLLALVMVLSLSPAPFALAEEPEGTIAPVSEPAPEPSDSAGDGAFDVSPAEPAAEPVADEPQDSHAFTTQPQDGTVVPDGSLIFTWGTNFSPVRVEIVRDDYHYDLTGEWHEYIVLASLAGSKTSHTLSYDDLCSLDSEDSILVRSYYGSGEQDYAESRAVKVTVVARAFTVQPTGGTVAPRGALTFTWETNFDRVKVEIVRDDVTHYFGGVDHEYTVLATLVGSKTSHTMSYDELSVLDSEDTIFVRAYYDSDSFVRSDPADITLVSRAFTVQPIGGHVEPGGTLTFTWETNFDRVKVEIVRDDATHYLGGVDHEYIVLTTLAGSKTSHTMSYDELSALDSEDMILVRAYYDSDSFVRSDPVDVTLTTLQFILQPTGGEVPVGASLTTTWATNFAPAKVEIVRESVWFDLVNEHHDYTVLATVDGAETSYPLPFVLLDSLGPLESIHVRAYYGTSENRYIMSDPISFTLGAENVSGYCGYTHPEDASWVFADGVLTISGEGYMADYNSDAEVPWRYLSESIHTVVVEEGILGVGDYAFSNSPALATVYLPSTLIVIEDYAFDGCPALTDAHINMSLQQFSAVTWDKTKNTGLRDAAKHFTFIAEGQAGPSLTWKLANDGVLSFSGSGAMYNWTSSDPAPWYPYRSRITQVRLAKVTTVGDYAFRGCSKLSSASFPSELTYLGVRAFGSCSSLAAVYWAAPNSTNVTEIPEACFSGCTALQSFTVPKKCAVIGQGAFSGCDALTKVSFPEGSALTTVGKRAFYSCDNLGNINLPEGVTSLGDEAFYNCKSLTSFPLPSTLTSLGASCFSGCSAVTGVVTIPAGVAEIPNHCFYGCSGFYKLALSPGTNQIGRYAFYGCSKLTQVDYDGFRVQWEQETTLNSSGNAALINAHFTWLFKSGKISGTEIYWRIFGGPGELEIYGSGNMKDWETTPEIAPWYLYRLYIETIDIHASVESVGINAFRMCKNLKTVYLPNTLKKIGSGAFNESSNLTDVWYEGTELLRQYKLTVDGYNNPLLSAQWHYAEFVHSVTGSNGVGAVDLFWSFDPDSGTLRVYWSDEIMDQNYLEIPDYVDGQDTPWYQYNHGQLVPLITAVQVDELVTRIGDYAFAGLSDVLEVQISSTVTSIGEGAFMGCGSLESVTIPDTVETLGDNIFWGCGSLETATLPAGLTEIPYGAFYDCEDLHTVYIPGTLESIGQVAFKNCGELTDVYFNGSSAQWKNIEKGSGNEALGSATIHFIPPEIAVDAVNFPDPAFRAYVAQYIDRDDSGYLDDYELQEANVIYASNLGIQSLQGIAFFYNLTHLDVSGNPLGGSLDLTTNTLLQNVNVSNCELNGLELTGLTHLNTLLCSDNDTGMSAPDLSTNLALEILDCHNCDGMEGLDLSANVNLTDLDCSWNQLESLDLSANTELQQLNCSHNSLSTLDLSANTELRQVYCNDNLLTSLELGQRHYSFITLSCFHNDLSFLDLTGCPRLREAVLEGTVSVTEQYVEHRIGSNYVQSDPDTILQASSEGIPIDTEHFPDDNFRAYVANELDPNGDLWLTLQELWAVEDMDCSEKGIASLQGVEYFTELQTLNCSGNELTSLRFTANPLLKKLDCSGNEGLAALDVSSLGRLEVLYCNGCRPLTALEVSVNTGLKDLDCRECALTGLTLGLQEDLYYLDCQLNQLSVLDLSGCPALQNLMCSGNALTALDLSACPGLRTLECYDNNLTGLDLSFCQELIMADCHDNALTVLFLGHQPKMKELYCQHNSLTSLDVMDCPYLLDLVQTTEPIHYEDYVYYTKDACEFDLDPGVTLIQDHEGIPIDAEHFPDPAFRAYLHDVPDADGNWYLNSSELADTYAMYIDGLGITSLQGIHYFTELEELECNDNQITRLDLSANTLLTYLNCDNNPLTELDLSVHASLNYLNCANCLLTSLDLTNCLSLISADCSGNAQLNQLILPNVHSLYSLNCSECALTSLDVMLCTGLMNLDCSKNGLTELYLGENENLGILACYGNSLQRVDIFGCPILVDLYNNGSFLEKDGVWIWYRPNTSYALRVDPSTVPVADHDGIPVDEEHFPDPAFRAYVAEHCDTSGNGWLNEEEINAVSSINVSGLGIESLEGVGYFTLTKELVCYNNSLTELDLEGLSLLHYLDAHGNPFTTLDLSPYPSLTMVELCGTPSLTSLNVAGLTQLGYLDVSTCGLTALDVSSCRSLYFLDCCGCEALESLILGESETMEDLYAYHTPALTQLDLSGCPKLAAAWLDGPDKVEDGIAWYYGAAGLPCEMALDPDQAVITQSYLPGDINGDGELNNKDVTSLIRYLKYRDITVVEAALDVNGDGDMNNKDVTTLIRYLKYHDVVIH